MYGWKDGRMDGRIEGVKNGWMDVEMEGLTDLRKDRWLDGLR